ncbi:MAG: F0F1 ATP synthase subunit B [Parachlamydiales bacterium]|jgi:F-type H+-transporting ATPase subunit b
MSFSIEHIITQIIAFILMLYVLKRFAWKPLLKILDDRTEKIRKSFVLIEEQKLEVNELAQLYENKILNIKEEGRVIIQEAVKQGREIADDIQHDAQNNAKEILKKAHEEVQRELVKARIELKNEIINTSTAIFEKLAHTKLNQAENEKLVSKLMDEVELK